MDNTTSNCSFVSDNGTLHNCSDVTTSSTNASSTLAIFTVIQVLLVLFILTGNTLILLAIRQGNLIRKVSYYFIANLAVADILFGLSLVLRLVFVVTGSLNTQTCVFILSLATITGLTSATGILFLCLESYLAVRHIVLFKTAFTPKFAMGLIAGSWLATSAIPLMMLYHPDADVIPPAACNFGHPYFNRIFRMVVCLVGLLIMFIIVVLELLTVYHVRKHVHGMLAQDKKPAATTSTSNTNANTTSKTTTTTTKPPAESERQKRMLARVSAMSQLVALILVCYIVTWGPYLLALLLFTVCPACKVGGALLVYLTLVISLNSAANVVIFAVKSREFRKAFRKMLPCGRRSVVQVEPAMGTTFSM